MFVLFIYNKTNTPQITLIRQVLIAEGDMSESQIEWLKSENARLTKQVEQLIKDMHRIDSARQSAVSQCAVMAERIEELEAGLFVVAQLENVAGSNL